MDFTKVSIDATIDGGLKKVWDCYNQPEHITKWNFADDSWHCPKAENNLRVGGKLKSRMEAKDGSFGFDFEGVYTEIVENEKLSYSLEDGRQVTTLFENSNGKTKVTTIFDAEKENPIEMQKGGWQAILNNFKKHVEND